MGGADHAERMRHMDEILTEILNHEYGKYLGFYPPVYIMSKCLQIMRPFYIECENEKEFRKQWSFSDFWNNYGGLVENGETESDQNPEPKSAEKVEESPKPKKKQTSFFSRQKTNESSNSEKEPAKQREPIDSPKPQKKAINWFFGNDNDNNKKADSQSKKHQPDEVKKEEDKSSTNQFEMSSDSIYYPFEDSDIDEDNESDVEGGYDFYHDSDNADGGSIKSEKELTEMYEKELKMKLVENYVNKDTQESKKSYKRSNSLKKLVNKFKK